MSTKMQQLLDYIVNEEMDKANELFHEIVVEKSREIYENLIAEEAEDEQEESVEEADDEQEESVEEADDEQEESVEEGFGMDDETSSEIGGDAGDNFVGDVGADDASGDDGDMSAPADKGDIQDLEDALAELKAEFEALVGGADQGDDDMDDMDMDMDADDEEGDADDEEGDEDDEDAEESMGMYEGRRLTREYVEKINHEWEKQGEGQENKVAGAGSGEVNTPNVNTKPVVSSGKGKPATGANAGNILGKSATANEDGTSPKGKVGGVVKKGSDLIGKVENSPGAHTKGYTNKTPGHGAEKKGSGPGPVGSGTGDKAGQTSVGQVKSPLNGAPNRNA